MNTKVEIIQAVIYDKFKDDRLRLQTKLADFINTHNVVNVLQSSAKFEYDIRCFYTEIVYTVIYKD